ncbi:MAG: hypothetical protein R3275_12515 [Saprospiraceae bacterium]|nr:hypothetical protein [Saprospiraceae bacterium]
MKLRNNIIFLLCLLICLSCSKEENLVPDNDPFSSFNISDLKIENYVNRVFIDIIGREPIDEELDAEVEVLKDSSLNRESRVALVTKLMEDTTFRENEFSYHAAYIQNLYNLAKARCIESVGDDEIQREIGLALNGAYRDSLVGNWDGYYNNLEKVRRYRAVIQSRVLMEEGLMDFHRCFAFMIDNGIYDVLNMNTFNFVRASFDQLLWRLPSEQEYENAFNMIEFHEKRELFGEVGSDKSDYIRILIDSPGMLEGMVIWAYQTLLNREPTPSEVYTLMQEYAQSKDIGYVITQIVVTDEYASFR